MTHQELKDGIKEAMKARDVVRLSVLRGLSAAATNEVVSKGRKPDEILNDDEFLTVVMRAAKQRKDSIEQFTQGGRADLAEGEKAELAVIESMLPAQMSREEVLQVVRAKAAEMGLLDLPAQAGKTGANKLMGALMKDLKGKADGNVVKEVVSTVFP
jgi:uncharacterized protein YqeY